MRLTGLGLFVPRSRHYIIVHFLYDPAEQTAGWITDERWGNIAWRTADWLMLVFVVFHAFMGLRIVVGDYTAGGSGSSRRCSCTLGALVFAIGTIVGRHLPVPG